MISLGEILIMPFEITIAPQNPDSTAAQGMIAALWNEIQERYHFTGACDINPDDFKGSRASFLVASVHNLAVGSVGLKPLSEDIAELNALYVAPEVRKQGVAQALLHEFEVVARDHGFSAIRLRAGDKQPEALRFYQKMGFHSISCFGEYASSETNQCFEKQLW